MRSIRQLTRRSLLRAATVTALATGTASCSNDRRPIQVAVVWSGDELQRFRQVLSDFTASNSRHARAISVGDDIDGFLRARQLAGTAPDVAILSRPGLVLEYARRGWLATVDPPQQPPETPSPADSTGSSPGPSPSHASPAPGPSPSPPTLAVAYLNDLLTVDGKLYGTWIKVAHKSVFWHRSGFPSDQERPSDWNGLVSLTEQLARRARQVTGHQGPPVHPLAIGAADGWVLTDWFENVLADVDGHRYEQLAQGDTRWDADAVHVALHRLWRLWRIPGALPGGGRRALLTQFDGSVVQLVRGQAVMLFEGDFTEVLIDGLGPVEPFDVFRFPGADPARPPMIFGGDAAVVWRDSPHGAALVRWLGAPEGVSSLRNNGFSSPYQAMEQSHRPPGRQERLARELQAARNPHFDLSDRLPAPFTGSDGAGIWRIMQDFFEATIQPSGSNADKVIRGVQQRLKRAAEDAWRNR